MEEKKEQELSQAKAKAIAEAIQLFADCSADKIPAPEMMRKLADVIEQAEKIEAVVDAVKAHAKENGVELHEFHPEDWPCTKTMRTMCPLVDDNPSDSELEKQIRERGGEKDPDFDVDTAMPTLEELEARRKEIDARADSEKEPIKDAALEIINRQVDGFGKAVEASLPLERIVTDRCKNCSGGDNCYGYPSCGAPGQANVLITLQFNGGYYGGRHGLCFRFKK